MGRVGALPSSLLPPGPRAHLVQGADPSLLPSAASSRSLPHQPALPTQPSLTQLPPPWPVPPIRVTKAALPNTPPSSPHPGRLRTDEESLPGKPS